ncbi:MAG TPA: AmmeMemoRadiSam system protein B [Anaerolineae bacterium]|nr:AmmeMemoRadiSam system protein B [Anaerolineae bacterium]
MTTVRQPAVAGTFYPAHPETLRKMVQGMLDIAQTEPTAIPKAMIVPHAGYIYSGEIAATGYRWLRDTAARDVISRVVLVGPAHYVPVRGLAVDTADIFATPLGEIPVDTAAIETLLSLPQVVALPAAHAREHSLEVQLPFLQTVLGEFSLVPLAAGQTDGVEVADVLSAVWGGRETLIVISSDLSHFLDYESAREIDRMTAAAIENLQPDAIGHNQACGRVGIQGLLLLARRHNLRVQRVDLRNSGDTAGSKDRVVGYGAWVFLE